METDTNSAKVWLARRPNRLGMKAWSGLMLVVVSGAIIAVFACRQTLQKTASQAPASRADVDARNAQPSPRGLTRQHEETAAPRTENALPNEGPPPATAPQTWAEAVDLLKLVNVDRDTVSGAWGMVNGTLRCDAAEPARLEIPYIPPKEYDFRIVFTVPVAGCVGQVLYANGHQFGWYMGAYVNTFAGFQMIDGKAMPENPTGVKVCQFLQPDRQYTALVEVRKDGVKAYVDGKLLSQWSTDYHDMSLFPESRLRGQDLLGLWTAAVATTFHSAQVREVTGKGISTGQGQKAPGEF